MTGSARRGVGAAAAAILICALGMAGVASAHPAVYFVILLSGGRRILFDFWGQYMRYCPLGLPTVPLSQNDCIVRSEVLVGYVWNCTFRSRGA